MPIDRNATLKAADKLIKQGKLEGAIQEYVRLVEDQPSDWNAMNALGDLYVRTGDRGRAVEQFTRIADHLFDEGFFPRAAAVYKKALKTEGGHEHSLLRLAGIAARHGLAADARQYAAQVVTLRRSRGDERGAQEPIVVLGELDDPDVKVAAARAAEALANVPRAAALFREAAAAFHKAGREAPALEALVEFARLTPADASCVDAALDMGGPDRGVDGAMPALEAIVGAAPHVLALAKIVEIARAAGRDALLRRAQVRLADALLDAGRGADARAIAEELVALDPSRDDNVARLRRALELTHVPDPETVIRALVQPSDPAPPPAIPAAGGERPDLDDIRASLDVTLQDFYAAANAPPEEDAAIEVAEVDLSDALSGLPTSPATAAAPPADAAPLDLDQVFEAIRARVRDHEDVDPAGQLRRGIQLLEQGHVDEAVEDLQAAARTPALRFEAASRLGYAYAARGDLDRAAEWLERASEAPASSLDAGFAVLYELAGVLERQGRTERALDVLVALDADAPAYRDVPARIEHLTRPRAGSRGL